MDDKRLERIEQKLDDSNDHLVSIDITLAAQHVSLKEHVRRTRLLEEAIVPIKKHVNMVEGAVKLLMTIGVILSALVAFKALK